ncbi:MAG TPA: IS256 family transposase [Spirochaetota bacterium]|jgi:transposase-like protein|nr:IS256 family transposase [Rectinema sp.]HPW52713.1 IS256 family transposase [Spirochaetota bacterium]
MTERKRNRKQTTDKEPDFLDNMLSDVLQARDNGERIGISTLIEKLINELMERDRDNHLKEYLQTEANGFYKRDLNLLSGQIGLSIPRIRSGSSFRPAILPPKWKRVDKDYEELLIAMLSNGYSYAQIERACKSLKLPFSKESLSDSLDFIAEKMDFYKTRPLESKWFAVFIDAYHCQMRDENRKNNKTVIYVACGIKFDGTKEILGFWTLKGSENKAFWTDVLQDLIQRGATKILSIITDDFNGLQDVIKKLYPLAYRQLCMVHLARNLHRNVSKLSAPLAMKLWRQIKDSSNIEEGEIYFDKLVDLIRREKPDYADYLHDRKDNYLTFLIFPEPTRKHFYTTNAVESINSGIERMEKDLGGYFASIRCLEVNLFIQFSNLSDLWLRKPIPAVRSCLYELQQIFALRYSSEDLT